MPYNYGGYPVGGYYSPPPMPDQLAQLRGAGYQQPMQQPMMGQAVQSAQMPITSPAQTQPVTGINWVQGEEGARAWMVSAGNTVLLMDSDGSSFYLKSADASGMPQPLRIFDYVERTQTPKTPAPTQTVEYVTRADFDALIARYDAMARELDELKANTVPTPTKVTRKAVKEVDE